MIPGYATPEETAAHAEKHHPVTYRHLGATRLWASQAGFGGYRISTGVPAHAQALEQAFAGGVNLVDTSANYADGGSEKLLGEVMSTLIKAGTLSRRALIVVSKVGYLQGRNFARAEQRKQQERPFQEVVPCGKGMEHCIHPHFLEDQLERSLKRLGLDTLDFYLLHNPEYYLEWAHQQGVSLDDARETYYRRIESAFGFLERAVAQGRIRNYGISSNTFAGRAQDPDFTCLETVWRIAESVSARHHFRLVQMPLNLFEPAAVLENNQLNGQSVLQRAQARELGVLINRPLNAFAGNQLIRLADVKTAKRQDRSGIIRKIRALSKSEKTLWAKLIPDLDIPPALVARIKEQIAIGDNLKHYHLNFGSYEKWRQTRINVFMPRVRGVLDYLEQTAPDSQTVTDWMEAHVKCLQAAFDAVGSIYGEAAAIQVRHIKALVNAADDQWAPPGTLSQKAIRAVRSTSGVSTVLVGMRRKAYVDDVLHEIKNEIPQQQRLASWRTLHEQRQELIADKQR